MKKKLVLFLIVALLPTLLFARKIDMTFGATMDLPVSGLSKIEAEKDMDIKGGFDMRLKYWALNCNILATWGKKVTVPSQASPSQPYDSMLAVGLAYDFFDTVRVGVVAGPHFKGFHNPDDDAYNEANRNVMLSYRATVDFLFNAFSSLTCTFGVSYQVDSTFSFDNAKGEDLIPDWKNGRLGTSLMFSFFLPQ